MTQQTLVNEGCFDQTLKNQINSNFTELYNRTTGVRQSADVPKATSTTLSNLTGLSLPVEVGTYDFKVLLRVDSTTNGGAKVAFNYTNAVLGDVLAATSSINSSGATTVGEFASTTNQASIVSSLTAFSWIKVEGTMVVTTAGTINVQGAQNTSHADTTVFYTDSLFTLTKIA